MKDVSGRKSIGKFQIGIKWTFSARIGMIGYWIAAAQKKKQKILYFTRSAGFEHEAVKVKDGQPSISDKILTELGQRYGFEVVCTKDGRVFDGDLDQYDAIAFYTSGVLTEPNKAKTPPMTLEGKNKLLKAIVDGKGIE